MPLICMIKEKMNILNEYILTNNQLMQIKTVKLQFIATAQMNFQNKSQLPMILKMF